jgi:hypothetical protein
MQLLDDWRETRTLYVHWRRWYRDAAELYHGFIGARKKWISEISSCQYKTRHHGKVYTGEFVSLRCHALRDCVNFTNFVFWIKCHFNISI